MSSRAIAKLKEFEGRTVGIALRGGERIDECKLISLPLRGAEKFWLWTGAEDIFLPPDQVLDVWEAGPAVAG
ncbi:MAG: hypothetical protein ACRDG9_14085 [Actinomycetota bacterium]|jgi:hypothetical protein